MPGKTTKMLNIGISWRIFTSLEVALRNKGPRRQDLRHWSCRFAGLNLSLPHFSRLYRPAPFGRRHARAINRLTRWPLFAHRAGLDGRGFFTSVRGVAIVQSAPLLDRCSPVHLRESSSARRVGAAVIAAVLLVAAGGCGSWMSSGQNSEGVRLFSQGSYDAAAQRFSQAMQTEPNNPDS